MNNLKEYKWPANSALFHIVKGTIFLRDKLAFKVREIYHDQNDLNLRIENEARLSDSIFKEISKKYNDRIIKHQLKYNRINDKGNLKIIKFKLIGNSSDDNEISGTFSIYPRVFICTQCSRYRYFRSDENILTKCESPNCNGHYEQLSLLKYCETCGKVEEFYYRCENRDDITKHPANSKEFLKLNRPITDDIGTWRFKCEVCGDERDPFNMWCIHKDPDGTVRSDTAKTKFKPLTIREGSIFTPLVITTVDLPNTDSIGLPEAEYVMMGICFGFFNELKELLLNEQSILDLIEKMYFEYKDESLKKREFLDEKRINPSITLEEFEKRWETKKRMDIFKRVVHDIKNNYGVDNFNKIDFNNFNALKGMFRSDNKIKTYLDFCNEKEGDERNIKISEYDSIKSKFKISELNYLPRIKLISSCIGFINGVNKFYEAGFIPHFEPIWKDNNRQIFNAYSYPYETEGVLIEFDKDYILQWLKKNNIVFPNDNQDPNKFFINLKEDTKSYKVVYTLMHTLSHLLLRKSSVYTGIDADSCGEKIFPNNCAILVYSTGNINTGGFQFLFENSLFQLFNEINVDLNKCIYDPLCKKKSGSCFSCLYLAEHVCCNFNQELDRDILLGEGHRGIKFRFWEK